MKHLTRHVMVPAYVFWPAAYLATLAVGMVLLWWVILIGGNPITITNIGTVDQYGEPERSFRPGTTAGLRRKVCSETQVGVQYFPALRNQFGAVFPLPTGMSAFDAGCRGSVYGFVVPELPPGIYTIVNTVRFQNNLVGRDEYTALPPIEIEVLKR